MLEKCSETSKNHIKSLTGTQIHNGYLWSLHNNRQLRLKFQTTCNNEEIVYKTQDGQILTVESVQEEECQEVKRNLDLMKNLQWIGEYENKKKVGKWIATWYGDILKDVGGQYNEGIKQGFWKEPINNFQGRARVFQAGEYLNGKRVGWWKFQINDTTIGGGFYNQQGLKIGIWNDISEMFYHHHQIFYQGQYQEGVKIGKWNIIYNELDNRSRSQIGGGIYDKMGVKKGKWVEVNDNFRYDCQILFSGDYLQGMKVGQWDILFRIDKKFKFKLIGGGTFDLEELKNGEWIELFENYYKNSQIMYCGKYREGKKIDRWFTFSKKRFENQFNQIECGYYNQQGEKTGLWIEPTENCFSQGFTEYNGKYNNGFKIGRWDILETDQNGPQIIGGGLYEEQGLKQGPWVEIHDDYSYQNTILFCGEYDKGKKIGYWDIKQNDIRIFRITPACYDEQSLKNGKWVELDDSFYQSSKIIHKGQYKNGKKVDKWDTYWFEKKDQITLIGGGSYNEKSLKNGEWIDLDTYYQNDMQFIYKCTYKNGLKTGRCDILFKSNHNESFELIGGGQYNNTGIQIGQWVVQHDFFLSSFQVVQKGEFVQGLKNGRWVYNFRIAMNQSFQELGGGEYDEKGQKDGKWHELQSNQSGRYYLTIDSGQYNHGRKVGIWRILQQQLMSTELITISQQNYPN